MKNIILLILTTICFAFSGCESTSSATSTETKPHAQFPPKPEYPKELKDKNLEATVTVKFTLTKDGIVKHPEVIKTTNPAFNQAAIECVLQTPFITGTINGNPIDSTIRIPIVFKPNQG